MNFVSDVFVQYCYFLKQAGQIEKAVASFQAQIEYNLFCPSAVQGMYEESMYLFESFWDSGVSRVGESGAKGWSYWYTNKEVVPESQATENSKSIYFVLNFVTGYLTCNLYSKPPNQLKYIFDQINTTTNFFLFILFEQLLQKIATVNKHSMSIA